MYDFSPPPHTRFFLFFLKEEPSGEKWEPGGYIMGSDTYMSICVCWGGGRKKKKKLKLATYNRYIYIYLFYVDC